MSSVFLLQLTFHTGWAFVTPMLNSPLFFVLVSLYLHLFWEFNNLILCYEQSFWGFLSLMPLGKKKPVVVTWDCSQKFLSLISKVLFTHRYSLRILLVSLAKLPHSMLRVAAIRATQWQSQRSLRDRMTSWYKMAQGQNMPVLHLWHLTSE